MVESAVRAARGVVVRSRNARSRGVPGASPEPCRPRGEDAPPSRRPAVEGADIALGADFDLGDTMKRLIQDAVRWLSAEWTRSGTIEAPAQAGELDSERRLREMQESGKTLFLP